MSQSNLDVTAGEGLSFTQVEGKDKTTLQVGLSDNLGRFGSFWSTQTQTAASTTTSYVVTLNEVDGHDQVSLESGQRIRVEAGGTYNFQTSVQVTNTDTQAHDVTLWLRKNGVDITQSASVATVSSKHGGINGHHILAFNLIVQMGAGDYLELVWAADSTSLQLETIAAGASPVHPLSPSVIITLTQVNLSSSANAGPSTDGPDYGTFAEPVGYTMDMGSF